MRLLLVWLINALALFALPYVSSMLTKERRLNAPS